MTRRSIFSKLAALPFVGALFARSHLTGLKVGDIVTIAAVNKVNPETGLASGAEILKSFDARDWARHFVAHAKAIPGLATDEETMTSWFANALMRGYDEARRHQSAFDEVPNEWAGRNSRGYGNWDTRASRSL